jgi:hypothetical protein
MLLGIRFVIWNYFEILSNTAFVGQFLNGGVPPPPPPPSQPPTWRTLTIDFPEDDLDDHERDG